MKNQFKIVPDKYYRGNGRWAKVTRLHTKGNSEVQSWGGIESVWTPYWHVSYGKENEITAFCGDDFDKSKWAHSAAKDYIKEGV
jgi:hypothetical protein